MLIRNYGLFWRRDALAEEWPRSGQLLGLGVRRKRQRQVDFARQRGIYALYDDNFRLIYVGQAGRGNRRLYARLRLHTRGNLAERWSRFSWFGILPLKAEPNTEGFLELDETERTVEIDYIGVLDQIEAVLITAGEPIRNSQGGRFGKDVVHYRQYRQGSSFDPDDTSDLDEE